MSTVPAALSALVARLQTSPAIAALKVPGQSDVLIQDGPWVNRPDEPDVICIGWLPDEGDAVSLTSTFGLGSGGESYDVTALASSWSGDSGSTDLAARRVRVDALVEAVRAELQADPTLGGVVTHSEVTSQSWAQFQTKQGCEVPIQFVIHIEAFRLD